MGKLTDVGSLPPDRSRFSEGTQVFTCKRPEKSDKSTEASKVEKHVKIQVLIFNLLLGGARF
jgi:hypothetical protein